MAHTDSDEAPWALAPGERVGDWRVVARLGRGGMGEVYAVEGQEPGPRLALKLFTAEGRDADFLRQRFGDMGRALQTLGHPRVVRVSQTGELWAKGRRWPFVLMALVGVTPDVRAKALRAPSALLDAPEPPPEAELVSLTAADLLATPGTLPAPLLERLWADAAEALRWLHAQGIVHGDIKPANLLLSAGGHATLADFGLARIQEEASRPVGYEPTLPDLREAIRGTPEYLAPELLRGGAPTPAADLYALGLTFFLLRTGVPYVDGPVTRLLLEGDLPLSWRGRFQALLCHDPAARHWPDTSRFVSRRVALALGGAALLGAFGGGAWAAWAAWRAPARRWARGEPLALGIGERASVGQPLGTTLPPLVLGRGAGLTFALGGGSWRLGEASIDETATLTLRGPGSLLFPRGERHAFRGRLRLTEGATAHFESKSQGKPAVAVERGATLSMNTGNNRYASEQFREINLSRGGNFRSDGRRLYLNYRPPLAVRLGQGARFVGDIVACGARVHAESGDCRLEGRGLYLWSGLVLSAAKGATLTFDGGLFMYDYWKTCSLDVSENAGTVILTCPTFRPLCAVNLRSGRTVLRTKAAQDVKGNWCRNKTCQDWHLAAGASLAGTGSVTFSPTTCLRVDSGGTLEGGEGDAGTLTLSRTHLASGAILDCRGGRLAFGWLAGEGVVSLRCGGAAPGPLFTWESALDPLPTFRAEDLPPGHSLRVGANAVELA